LFRLYDHERGRHFFELAQSRPISISCRPRTFWEDWWN
jgi:hypothetical protein